ncbi:MAG: rRNA maturation RNase YbeY [Clostridia bacterium]|nr:rRNA maturation RNase YbeY [Clostridia bacterium]
MKETKLYIDFSRTEETKIALVHKSLVRLAILSTLMLEDFPYDARVSVTFTDNAYIHKLNRTYRSVDRPTDVLSFPMYADGDFPEAECIPYAELGDIVLSLERAYEQADEIGTPKLREVVFLTVHSTLHLLGYDHEKSEEDDALQCERQRVIMEYIEDKISFEEEDDE